MARRNSMSSTRTTAPKSSFFSRFKEWLEEKKHKFMGLDLEYTADRRNVAVIKLCLNKHVMVFQWAR
jgi:hypothetical protein